jgi:organic radical activating enzyme
MTFLRTGVCPIRCLYCDTPESHVAPATCVVHLDADRRPVEPNPVSVERAIEWIEAVSPEPHARIPRHLSITGGEPLVHPEFVGGLAAAFAARGSWRVHLETAALHQNALRDVLERAPVHHVSADYKVPSTLEGDADFAVAHRRCIELACSWDRGAEAITVDVKLVVTPAVDTAAIDSALDELAAFRDRILLVLQPVTPCGAVTEAPAVAAVEAMARRAGARGYAVRVLPQLHKALGLR